ncbi:MAG: hypothetical protein HKP12_08205 [Gammaproteobacteria bacterium]|nr:hypothetical protein [Gammaproteobacteria bacterium]
MKALSILPVVILMFIGTVMTGCEANEGPAEQAGEEIDNAVENTGEAIEEAGDKLEEKTQ